MYWPGSNRTGLSGMKETSALVGVNCRDPSKRRRMRRRWNSAAALNNGAVGPTNTLSAMWGTWGAPGNPTQDIATYTWENPVTVSSSKLYLWQNHLTPGGDSGVMIPAALSGG